MIVFIAYLACVACEERPWREGREEVRHSAARLTTPHREGCGFGDQLRR
eukprot:CAMPEP_0184396660 /NCGR_PEP_ID=MMETSP0007-20130409/54194_1 /TAXON_ID=97485 /ORGANISM="Prymnesium parvum, Strain Texoma1" /LENGTH=48 /DNA_ID= /DNA_START= /DNA_END= /DNA_ORIENTATION=